MPINRHGKYLEDDDFMVGEAQPVQAPETKRSVVESEDPTLDFQSIDDLIDSELQDGSFTSSRPQQIAQPPTAEDLPPEVEVNKIEYFENVLGEDFALVQESLKVHDRIQSEIKKLQGIERFHSSEKTVILDTLHANQKVLREHHSTLQEVVGQFIREGDIRRVNRIDQAKRQLDDLLLQIRALENRITNRGVSGVVAGNYVDGSNVQDIYAEAAARPHEVKGQSKSRRKRKIKEGQQSYGGFKVFMLLVLLSLMPIGYYLSANWGVQKAKVIRVGSYKNVMPLVQARGLDTGFNAIVSDSWGDLSEEEKKRAVEQLAAMVKINGYQTIFITYETKGMAVIYNAKNNQVVVK